MPGLIRGMARTAVVAGTATSVSNRVSRRQAQKWSAEEPQYAQAPPQPVYAEAPPAPAAPPAPSRMDQLKELGELHTQGVLTDAEFQTEKARILG